MGCCPHAVGPIGTGVLILGALAGQLMTALLALPGHRRSSRIRTGVSRSLRACPSSPQSGHLASLFVARLTGD